MASPPSALPISFFGKKVFQRWKESFPALEIYFSYLGNFEFLPRNRKVPPLEPKSSSVGTKKCLRWNSKVPPLELKSSKRGAFFGTRICNVLSTIRTSWRRGVLDGDSQIAVSRLASLEIAL